MKNLRRPPSRGNDRLGGAVRQASSRLSTPGADLDEPILNGEHVEIGCTITPPPLPTSAVVSGIMVPKFNIHDPNNQNPGTLAGPPDPSSGRCTVQFATPEPGDYSIFVFVTDGAATADATCVRIKDYTQPPP